MSSRLQVTSIDYRLYGVQNRSAVSAINIIVYVVSKALRNSSKRGECNAYSFSLFIVYLQLWLYEALEL